MKKSEIYINAMCCVVEDRQLNAAAKLKIIERLMQDKQMAEWSENKNEEDKENV